MQTIFQRSSKKFKLFATIKSKTLILMHLTITLSLGSVAQWFKGACLEIRKSRVQDPLWPLVEFDPGSPWFNFPAALVNSQLVCLQPVGILNSCCCSVLSFRCVSLALKSPYGERSIKYVLYCIVLYWLVNIGGLFTDIHRALGE